MIIYMRKNPVLFKYTDVMKALDASAKRRELTIEKDDRATAREFATAIARSDEQLASLAVKAADCDDVLPVLVNPFDSRGQAMNARAAVGVIYIDEQLLETAGAGGKNAQAELAYTMREELSDAGFQQIFDEQLQRDLGEEVHSSIRGEYQSLDAAERKRLLKTSDTNMIDTRYGILTGEALINIESRDGWGSVTGRSRLIYIRNGLVNGNLNSEWIDYTSSINDQVRTNSSRHQIVKMMQQLKNWFAGTDANTWRLQDHTDFNRNDDFVGDFRTFPNGNEYYVPSPLSGNMRGGIGEGRSFDQDDLVFQNQTLMFDGNRVIFFGQYMRHLRIDIVNITNGVHSGST